MEIATYVVDNKSKSRLMQCAALCLDEYFIHLSDQKIPALIL